MFDDPRPRPGILAIRPLPDRTGLTIVGEADLTVKDMLRAALAALPADGTGDIHLDLAGLQFIDVACTRELMAVARCHPAARVVIHHPPAALLRITALLYPDVSIDFTGASRPLAPAPDRPPAPGASPDGSSMSSPGLQAAVAVTDVTNLITDDQVQIRALLARISQLTGSCRDAPGGPAPGADDGLLSRTWAALARLLTAHLDAEQEICYLTMTAARPPSALLQAWAAGHFDIREALAETRLSAAGSARWLRAVSDASAAVIRHIQAEDHYLLPVLGQAPPETRGLLGRQWAALTLARLQDDGETDAARPGERRSPDGAPDHRRQPWKHVSRPQGNPYHRRHAATPSGCRPSSA
jgi:anti-anti-sigma regulatory factor